MAMLIVLSSKCLLFLVAALEAAESYMDIQPLHQTIGDAVVAALTAWARRELDKTEHGILMYR